MGWRGGAWPASQRRRGSKDRRSPGVASCGLAVAFLFLQGSQDGSQHLPLMGFATRSRRAPRGAAAERGPHLSTPVLPGLLHPPSFPPQPVLLPALSSPHRTIFARPTSRGPSGHAVLCLQNICQHPGAVPRLCSTHGCPWVCITHARLHHPGASALPT